MSSGGLLAFWRTVLASKYACLHSRANFEPTSEGSAGGKAATMLECQSRQVPMKSKRTALIGLLFERSVLDMIVKLLVCCASAFSVDSL